MPAFRPRPAILPELTLALMLGLQAISAGRASAAPDREELRIEGNDAFRDPQSPEVYRALAGMGVPRIAFDAGPGDPSWSTNDPGDVALLRRMFPDVQAISPTFFSSYDAGGCRTEQPLARLRDRVAAFGRQGAYVEQWLRVQRAVFAACKDWQRPDIPAKPIVLPAPLKTGDTRAAYFQAIDRPYQAAAALFYEKRYPEAARAFDRIARSNSPLRFHARYMAVAIRAGSQSERDGYQPLVPVAQSIRAAQALACDSHAGIVRRYAYDLVGWIGANDQGMPARRVQIRQALDALGQPLARIAADDEARRHYVDATGSRAQLHSAPEDAAALWNGDVDPALTGTRAMIEAARTDPLARWMQFPVSPYQPSNGYSDGAAWTVTVMPKGADRVHAELATLAPEPSDGANPWVHQALMWSERYRPELWTMVEAETVADRALPDQRGTVRIALDSYHQTRTAIMFGGGAGFAAAVSHLADPAVDRHGLIWTSTVRDVLRYLLSNGRLDEARTLRDRLGLTAEARAEDAPRDPAATLTDETLRSATIVDLLLILAEDEDHLVPLLTDRAYDQAVLLSRLPTGALRHLAEREDVPREDRSVFARMAWARTYALGRVVDARLDGMMRALNPDITAHWMSHAGRPIRPGNRRALRDVLATPALTIDIDDWARHRDVADGDAQGITDMARTDHNKLNLDNWWCPRAANADDKAVAAAIEKTLTGVEPWDDGEKAHKGPWAAIAPAIRAHLAASSFLLRATDAGEAADLTRIPSAPQLLTERVIAWVERPGLLASRKGEDAALEAAIQSTRWGCDTPAGHRAYSRKAFRLLHARFPGSDAAKRAKYWYN